MKKYEKYFEDGNLWSMQVLVAFGKKKMNSKIKQNHYGTQKIISMTRFNPVLKGISLSATNNWTDYIVTDFSSSQ